MKTCNWCADIPVSSWSGHSCWRVDLCGDITARQMVSHWRRTVLHCMASSPRTPVLMIETSSYALLRLGNAWLNTTNADDQRMSINSYMAFQLLYFSQYPLTPCNWLPKRGYYSIRKSCSTSTNTNFLNLYSAVRILACYSYKCPISSISHLSPCFLRDFKIPNTARLKFINEPMHRQILPSPGPRFAHRFRIGDVVHIHAHALLNEPREDFRMRRAADEAPGELDDQRTPTLEDSPDLWPPFCHVP